MKDKLGGNIMPEFVALRPSIYSYLMNDDNSPKNIQRNKPILKFNDYKNCLINNNNHIKITTRIQK